MNRIRATLESINARATALCKTTALFFLAAMTIVILIQVFCRYVLNNPLSWPEEAARYMMVWMTFLAAPYAYREGLFARIETTTDFMKPRMRNILERTLHILIILTAIIYLSQAIWMVERGGMMTSSALGISMRYVFAILPISFILIVTIGIEKLIARNEPEQA